MSCEPCSNGTALNLMNGMFGIRTKSCFALSGLVGLWGTFTRGVAPGWFVIAPSARYGACVRSERMLRWALLPFAMLIFVIGSPLFAANSPLADAVEKSDRTTI